MNLFELAAVLTLNRSDYDRGLDEAQDKANSFGSSLKSGLATAAKVSAAAIGAASTAVVAFSKQALDSYGNYEQLKGGIETLFGTGGLSLEEYAKSQGKTVDEVEEKYRELEKSQADAMANAAAAYTTAGLSANEYMETITSFAASLKQSLGEENIGDLASYANQAIVDMSDNANKMGTAMESIQYAYQGFAKQNYTMLDNLKLGYGGTKQEMERLLADAEKLMGLEVGSLDISNFSDIIVAIHAVQEELGIAGTTAKEASSTIQGSLSSMKSAWENLITGIADENADLPGLMNEVIESAVTAGENIVPRIEQVLDGIGTAIDQLGPILSGRVMPMISDMLPDIVEKGVELVSAIVDGVVENLPALTQAAVEIVMKLIEGIGKMLPKLVRAGLDIIKTLASGVAKNIKTIVTTITDIVLAIVEELTNPETLLNLLDAGLQIIMGLVEGIVAAIPKITEKLPLIIQNIIDFLVSAIPQIITTGFQLLTALVEELPEIITAIVAAIPQIIVGIINAIVESIPAIVEGGIMLFTALIQALPEIITTIVAAIPDIISSITEALINSIPQLMEAGIQLFGALVMATPEIIAAILKIVPTIIESLAQSFGGSESVQKMKDIGVNMIEGIWNGILQMKDWINEKVSGFFGGIVDGVKDTLGIHSPSKVFAEIGKFSALGVGEGFDDEFSNIKRDIDKQLDFTATANVQASGGAVSYSGYTAAANMGAAAPSAEVRQPLIVVLQLPSGVEVGRQYIEDINLAKRVDGLAY